MPKVIYADKYLSFTVLHANAERERETDIREPREFKTPPNVKVKR
jgi:hypothetical protein